MPGPGIEPGRPVGHGILSPERLPVPPPRPADNCAAERRQREPEFGTRTAPAPLNGWRCVMFRALFRVVLLLIVVVAAAAYLLGWKSGTGRREDAPRTVGTSGVNTERAREIGASVGERTAVGGSRSERALTDRRATAKAQAQMALAGTGQAPDVAG